MPDHRHPDGRSWVSTTPAAALLSASLPLADPFHTCCPFGTLRFVPLTSPVAVVRGDAKVSGTVTLEQVSESEPTTITYDLTGNDPNAERGFHIHTFGDNTNGCTSAGPHCM